MRLETKARLGPYEIVAAIGAGGMGEVYRAIDTRLNRTVAIKVLPEHLAVDADVRARFLREAQAISSLNHPRICALYDVGHQDASASLAEPVDFLVLEYVEGETLAARIARGPLPLPQALTIAIEICDALERAHRQGLTHRDVKPANVMITRAGVKILDFGLAKQRSPFVGDERTVAVTAAGAIVGTLHYMAPEQIEGREADARSDVWACGCVLYEMIAGAKPFDGASGASVIGAILERAPAAFLPEHAVAPRLSEIIRICLEKNPDERWQSARDLRRELTWLRDASPAEGAAAATPDGLTRRAAFALGGAAAAVAAMALIAIPVQWASRRTPAAAPAGPPVIVLMDSTYPERIYDDATRTAGGTNADDLTDLLRNLPVALLKENTSRTWHREQEVLQEHPALIVAHRSCFYDSTVLGQASRELSWDKFETFAGFIGVGDSHTKILAYARGSWDSEDARVQWIESMEQRFPPLRGRIDAIRVPPDRATFRNPLTGAEIRTKIVTMLKLQS